MSRGSSVLVVLLAGCATDNPLFGLTESGTQGGEGEGSAAAGPSSGAMVLDTTNGGDGTQGGSSPTPTTSDTSDTSDDESDPDSGDSMTEETGNPNECDGLEHFPLSGGGPAHTPQSAVLDDGSRVAFLGNGNVSIAHFPTVVEPSLDVVPAFQGGALLAGGAGAQLAIAVDSPSMRVAVGNGAYNFMPPILLDGMTLAHGGLAKVVDIWAVPTVSLDVFEVHAIDGGVAEPEYVDETVIWVDGDGTDQGVVFVYERAPPVPTCRIVPLTNDEAFGSVSSAASQECHTPTIAFDPALGGLMVYAREGPAEIRGIRIDPDGNATPTPGAHFPVLAAKGVDHPEVVRLPVSGDYWVVFDQGPELTAMVLDGSDPTGSIGGPKSFGGQANGNLQAFLVDDHPAVAFYTADPIYGAGVHVVVDCDVL